jgi:YVTN family beta-propeller protein
VDVSDIAVGDFPRGMAFCPSNGLLYVANQSDGNVDSIDPVTRTIVTADISCGTTARWICYCPSNNRIYVSNQGDDNLDAIDPVTDTVATADIVVGDGPNGMTYNPRTNRIYISHALTGSDMYVLDPARNAVVQQLELGTTAFTSCYCPSNGRVYAVGTSGGNVSVLT